MQQAEHAMMIVLVVGIKIKVGNANQDVHVAGTKSEARSTA
jgi:hypothetical protein